MVATIAAVPNGGHYSRSPMVATTEWFLCIHTCNLSLIYTGVLAQIQSTSGREASSNPPIESGLVSMYTRRASGFLLIVPAPCPHPPNIVWSEHTHTPVQGWGGGGGGVNPLQINDIHDYCYSFEKLRAEIKCTYCIIHLLYLMLIQHILRIS